jgi:S1-C subfamily serine protease
MKIINVLTSVVRIIVIAVIAFSFGLNVILSRRIANQQSYMIVQTDLQIMLQQKNNEIIAKLITQQTAFDLNLSNLASDVSMYQSQMMQLGEELKDVRDYVNDKLKDIKLAIVIDKIYKKQLEFKLMQINVFIGNDTAETLGSGASLKYNDKFYVLSAAHLVDNATDDMNLYENGQKIAKLKVLKIDHKLDLVLFEVEGDLVPQFYTELAAREPGKLDDLMICGNPNGIEDVVSEGKIAGYNAHIMYVIDHCYFGNSGGGVYAMDGSLVGIVSHMKIIDPNPCEIVRTRKPQYVLDGMVRLNVIKEFLADIK